LPLQACNISQCFRDKWWHFFDKVEASSLPSALLHLLPDTMETQGTGSTQEINHLPFCSEALCLRRRVHRQCSRKFCRRHCVEAGGCNVPTHSATSPGAKENEASNVPASGPRMLPFIASCFGHITDVPSQKTSSQTFISLFSSHIPCPVMIRLISRTLRPPNSSKQSRSRLETQDLSFLVALSPSLHRLQLETQVPPSPVTALQPLAPTLAPLLTRTPSLPRITALQPLAPSLVPLRLQLGMQVPASPVMAVHRLLFRGNTRTGSFSFTGIQ
jgi:hypothetical protein